MQYALDMYLNSATADPQATPQPPAPTGAPAGPYFKAWKWEWRTQADNTNWMDPGDRVLVIPPGQASGANLYLTFWDVPYSGSGASYQSVAGLKQVLVTFNFGPNNPGTPFAELGNSWGGAGTQGGTFPNVELVNGNWICTLSQTFSTPLESTSYSSPMDVGGNQVMVSWAARVVFASQIPGPLSIDVGMWAQVTNPQNQSPVAQTRCFYKDPEMQVDEGS